MNEFVLHNAVWTPIGDYGFKYYWDPFWVDPQLGTHEIHFINSVAGYSRQVTIHPESAKSHSYMTHLVQYHYKEVEEQWLRTKQR